MLRRLAGAQRCEYKLKDLESILWRYLSGNCVRISNVTQLTISPTHFIMVISIRFQSIEIYSFNQLFTHHRWPLFNTFHLYLTIILTFGSSLINDLILKRTCWPSNPRHWIKFAVTIGHLFVWYRFITHRVSRDKTLP